MATKVSIVICTADKPLFLARTLDSLGKIDIPEQLEVELVVVDNFPDTSHQVVENAVLPKFKVTYLQEPKKGKSRGLNSGLKHAQGDVIVFTDDDLRFPVDWITKLIQPILEGSADAVAGAVRLSPDLERPWMTPFHRAYFAEILEVEPGAFAMVGANMAFHRRVLNDVPEFDVALGPGAYGFGDDNLFSYMVEEAGYRLVFNPESPVIHCFDPNRLTRSSLMKHAEQLGRSHGYLAHHWHSSPLTLPHIRRFRKAFLVNVRRVLEASKSHAVEGCAQAELQEISEWAYFDQYIRESRNPRKYARPKADVRVPNSTATA
jgi:glycosyltransferase involved in cell wall biosynthesis